MWNSRLLNIFKTFVHPMWNSHMFSCSSIKMALCFAIINTKCILILVFGTIQILGRFINTLCKYIFMQWSTKFLGYALLQKICFNFWISKCRILWEEQIIKPRCNKVDARLYLLDIGKKLPKLVKTKLNVDFL